MARDRVTVRWSSGAPALVAAAAEETLVRFAAEIEADARRYAPVDTGRLRNSITAEPVSDGRVEIRARADYAAAVELGTSRSPAQPFLRPALLKRRGS